MAAKKDATQTRDSDQIRAFRKAARELGADTDEGRFQDALRKVAKHKPVEPTPKTDKEA
jgi:hypothetical protein